MAGNRTHTIAGIFFEHNIYLKTVEQEVGELTHLPRGNSTRGEHPNPLRPGESLEHDLEFVIPQALDNPRLWIVERSRILRYLPWLEETPLFPKLVIPVSATGLAQPD